MDLQDLYETAYKNSAFVKTQELTTEQTQLRSRKALGILLPTLEVSSTSTLQDPIETSISSSIGDTFQHNLRVTVRQPLFQGGAEYYGLQIATRSEEIAKLEELNSRLILYQKVALPYFNILRLRDEIEILTNQKQTLDKRIDFLRYRVRIGRNRSSEVLSVQSQRALISSKLQNTRNALNTAESVLRIITGLSKISVVKDALPLEGLNVPEEWNEKILKSPRIRANEKLVEIAHRQVKVAQAGYFPKVDLTGNYFLDRSGILQESKWNLSATASIELYSGGKTHAEVGIRELEARKYKLRLVDLKREVGEDFQAKKIDLIGKLTSIKELQNSLSFAKRAYQENVKEFNRGLVSNIDVLRSLEDVLEVQLLVDRKIFDAKFLYIQLKSLAGILPISEAKQPDDQPKPAEQPKPDGQQKPDEKPQKEDQAKPDNRPKINEQPKSDKEEQLQKK